MNVKRFLARTPREALALVRQALGNDAVVVQTKPAPEGVEMLAMAGDGIRHADAAMPAPLVAAAASDVQTDVEQLSMSTLSFQDYVRERMLRRRQAQLQPAAATEPHLEAPPLGRLAAAAAPQAAAPLPAEPAAPARPDPLLRDDAFAAASAQPLARPLPAAPREPQPDLIDELRSMRGLIEERFSALAFIDKLQRQPAQARLAGRLLDAGFSPALIKKLADALPADVTDETEWAAGVLQRNLLSGEAEPALEDQGGVYALVGSTGVGKTTSTAKLAAAFATRHGSSALGLVTLDAYRVAAHEQLRTYGRILGVPVHTAHDRASLEDLLDLLSAKKMVLIDTAGTAQRDSRTAELLEMVSHRSIRRLLVVNASAQGETIDDVMAAYRVASCRGALLSKIDEAVKLGPALDALIRHKLPVLGVANGQRVPEDWHRLSSSALIQRALRERPATAWKLDGADVNLIFAGGNRRAALGAATA